MIKRIQFLFLILSAFAFFSCSNQVEKSASVSFSLSKNSSRAITQEASGSWSLKISLSGGEKIEKSFEIQEDSLSKSQAFTLDDLTAGGIVKVDVNVYCGEVQYFKAKETQTLTLAEGENSVDIVLTKSIENSGDSTDDNSKTSTDDDSKTSDDDDSKTSTTGDSEISIADSGSISISAVDSDGNSYVYSSSSVPAIPYLKATTFTISNATFNSYTWYLNGEKLSGTGSSISLTPAENNVSLSGNNSLVCFYGTNFSAEFKFTTSDSTSTDTSSATTE